MALAIRALAAVAVAATGLVSFAFVRQSQQAELRPDQDLPDDVRAEVDASWAAFDAVFGAHRRCYGDVALRLVPEVADGDARYVVDGARIEIEIPTSPARFRDSLVHELAHHVEHTCPAFARLREDFARLPGVDGRAWTAGDRWQDVPSELWAETAVELVIGRRVRHGRAMPLPPGAVELVSGWAAGDGVNR